MTSEKRGTSAEYGQRNYANAQRRMLEMKPPVLRRDFLKKP